ncbi:stage V sporulation protein E [Clostridium hydrogeniformans]|uniref:stage V sporulation protein E n=1 Tax=Clostridium hydrogeniformans TaxID=349933 RepID=UPI000484D80B|nr:stage V sporulation protein E [Clostridium hydrogeniformans]
MKKNLPNKKVDFILFSTIMVLLAIGIVMVYSASSYFALHKYGDSMFFFKRQLLWGVLGFVAMVFTMSIDYHKYKKYAFIGLLGCIPLLIAVFFFPPVNGARRWINLGIVTFQPSEITKYAVAIFLAASMSNQGEKMKEFKKGVLPYLLISGFFAGLILLEKNMSIATVIMTLTLIVMFVAGSNFKHLVSIVLGVFIPGLLALAFAAPYRRARMLNFLDPWKDAAGNGYQLIQSFYALGSGRILGLGLGASRQKAFYMPEPHNDFIFAIIGEELGLIGCLFVIAMFLIFIWRGITIAQKSKDTYGTLLAVGITSVIAIQAVINIAVVTGSMPVTGVPLPFISSGGTSLVINMIAMGILLNVSRNLE